MSKNHIIIGIGGTGGKIIRSFRKTIYRDFKQLDPEGVNVDYLYVDSSDEMMGTDDPSWKILGESVQLKQAHQLRLEGGSLASRLDDVHNYPGLSRWIGDKSNWGNILNIGSGAKILGGQKRRLGRFLFACHVEQFRTQISEIVRRMTVGEVGDVTFHVCCGLAGGTGSGSLIDAIVQLRTLYPEPRRYKILLYVLLPDRYPKATWNTGNYFANGYAALMELNALSVGRFRPHDVTGRHERVERLQDPFQACYLVTNDNENGVTLDVDKEVPEVIAMFLYQKIVVTTGISWQQLDKTEAFENQNLPPEGLDPALGERSRLFIAFGLKQLSYPEEEITELLTFTFARQAALQLAYNHWTSAEGFIEDPSTQDSAALFNDPQTLPRWKLSDAHLCLEQGIFGSDRSPEEKSWKSLTLEWQNYVQRLSSDIMSQTGRNWVGELIAQCQDRFDNKFRDCGVVAYYHGKLRNREDYAREICAAVEDSLFSDWKDGRRSMRDIATVLQQLLERLRERKSHWAEKLESAQRQRDAALAKVQLNATEWDEVGPLARVFGKQKDVFDAAMANATDFYTSSSYVQAWEFAGSVANEVEAQLLDLKGRADTAAALLRGTIARFARSIDERCVPGSDEDFKKHVVRLYRAEEVQAIVKKLVRDKDAQALQTSRARQAIVELLGDHPSFRKFSDLDQENLLDHLEKVCLQSVIQAHGLMVEQGQGRAIRLLGVSMIDKLKERYAGNPASMRTEIENIVKMAGSYLPISEAEHQKSGAAGTSTGNLIKMMTIMLPAAPEEKAFVDKLKAEFTYASKGITPEFLETESRRHEVTIVSLAHLFPLRFAEAVGFLRQAYVDRLKAGDTEQAKMLLHLEGDGQQHPSLFVPTMKSLGLPLIILGKATGLIVELKDDTGMTTTNALVTMSKDGLPKRLPLGRLYSECLSTIASGNNLATLNSAVSSHLASEEFRSAERRQAVKEKVRQEVNACDPKESSGDIYDSILEAAQTAMARIDASTPG